MRESADNPQSPQPVYAPPSPDKKNAISAQDNRGDKLSVALDEVLGDRQHTPIQEKSGMKLAEDTSVTTPTTATAVSTAANTRPISIPDKTSEEIKEEVAEQLRKVLEREEPKRGVGLLGAGVGARKSVGDLPPHPSILPPAVTEMEGGMSMLNIKLTNKREREFDWTKQQPVQEHISSPVTPQPSEPEPSLPTSNTSAIPPLDIPLFYPSSQSQPLSTAPLSHREGGGVSMVKGIGIGFDPRAPPAHFMLTESNPPSPLSLPSPSPRSELSATPRYVHGHIGVSFEDMSLVTSRFSSSSCLFIVY